MKQKRFNFKKIFHLIEHKTLKYTKSKICGEMIGSGTYRDVYVFKLDPRYVVKIERKMSKCYFANIREWNNYIDFGQWNALQNALAPCEIINEYGNILIQQRVEHRRRKDYPTRVLSVFVDFKLRNFGWIGDNFVCCDYSFLLMHKICEGDPKYRYAKWRGSLKHSG